MRDQVSSDHRSLTRKEVDAKYSPDLAIHVFLYGSCGLGQHISDDKVELLVLEPPVRGQPRRALVSTYPPELALRPEIQAGECGIGLLIALVEGGFPIPEVPMAQEYASHLRAAMVEREQVQKNQVALQSAIKQEGGAISKIVAGMLGLDVQSLKGSLHLKAETHQNGIAAKVRYLGIIDLTSIKFNPDGQAEAIKAMMGRLFLAYGLNKVSRSRVFITHFGNMLELEIRAIDDETESADYRLWKLANDPKYAEPRLVGKIYIYFRRLIQLLVNY